MIREKNKDSCGSSDESIPLPEVVWAEDFAKFAWGLAHPARVKIVQLLVQRESCVCGEIVEEMPLAQSTVSQHLKILKESGLVQGEVDGPRVCYCIKKSALKTFKKLVAAL